MPLEDILQSIDQRRNASLENIRKKYAEEMAKIEEEYRKHIESVMSSYERKTQEDVKALMERELSNADIKARSILRERKSALIEKQLVRAGNMIRSLPSTEGYADFLNDLVSYAKRALGRSCVIKANKRDAQILKDQKGIKIIVEDVDPDGGFIATTADGTMELDFTLSAIARDVSEKIAIELVNRFGGE